MAKEDGGDYRVGADSDEKSPPSISPVQKKKVIPTLSDQGNSPENDNFDPDVFINRKLPVILIFTGLFIHLIGALFISYSNPEENLKQDAFTFLFSTFISLIAVFMASGIMHFKLGNPGQAILKLLAVCIALLAVDILLKLIMPMTLMGFVFILLIEVLFLFTMLRLFFDLEENETWVCLLLIILTHISAFMFIDRHFGQIQ